MLLSIVREHIAQDQIGHACGGKRFTSTLHKNVYGMDCPNTGSLPWKTLLISLEKMSIILLDLLDEMMRHCANAIFHRRRRIESSLLRFICPNVPLHRHVVDLYHSRLNITLLHP